MLPRPAQLPSAVALLAALALTSPAPAAPRQASALPSFQQLSQEVADPSAKVRRQALRALAEQGGPEALVLLARLVNDLDSGIAESAIEAVIGIYVQPPPKRSMRHAADAFTLAPYHATPWRVPPELSDALVRALAHDQPSIRRDSAYAVGIVMAPPVTDRVAFELIASLGDREPTVRIAAARVLGRLQVRSAGVELIGRVNDEDLDVRLASMRALGDLRDSRAVEALTEQFSFYVRGAAGRAAIDALARIASPSSRPIFEAQTASGYPAHRQAAYEGLARIGELGDAVGRIEAAMANEKDERVTTAMAFALAASGRAGMGRILDALADRDRQDTATAYLIELGRTQAKAIAAHLADPNPVVREQIAIALGNIGGPDALAALSTASAETEPQVRRAIDVALFRLKQLAPRTGDTSHFATRSIMSS